LRVISYYTSKGMNPVKAITIHQPWATLIAIGEKTFETRSWATKYKGELAIHAGKKINKEACKKPEIIRALNNHGIVLLDDLPTGAIVAVCELVACYEVSKVDEFQKEADLRWTDRFIWGKEFNFGWYAPGRFAWELTNGVQYLKPIPAKGQQGLWNWRDG
jgi:hypothetical protein